MKLFLSLLLSTVLTITTPLQALALTYTIQRGDTLSSIAKRFDTTVQELATSNGIPNPNLILAGETLEVGEEELVGGSGGTYTPVTGYQSRLSTFISSSASTINVASTKDPAGRQISISDVSSSSSARIYLNIAPGTSKEEIISCTGNTASTWTGCTRGLDFQGGSMSASTTLAFAHNAGTAIVISNVGQFYTEYVSRTGTQDIYDIKTFYNYPKFAVTTTVPTLGAELATKYYVDNVGAGGFTSSNVSTTRGLSVDGSVPERVGINASTTRALAFDSDGKIYVNASSTKALKFDSNGALYFDETQNLRLSGNVTTTGNLQVQAPTSTMDVTNKGYVDNSITFFTATGTAGMAITAGRALYISSTSTIFHTDTDVATSTFKFIGIAAASASNGGVVTYYRPGGIACNLSGLTAGDVIYLNGTAGQVSGTPGTFKARVGLALSSGCVQVVMPKYWRSGTRSVGAGSTGAKLENTGFYPAKISIMAAPDSTDVSGGSVGNESGYLQFGLIGANNSVIAAAGVVTYVCFDRNASATECAGALDSRSQAGFIINVTTASVAHTYIWLAESE